MKKVTIIRITKTEFEIDDGRIFEHPVELENIPTIKEFQDIYDKWQRILEENFE